MQLLASEVSLRGNQAAARMELADLVAKLRAGEVQAAGQYIHV